jgi:hypothetical protein
LEKQAIQAISDRVGNDFWDLYIELDSCFESIAANGTTRLMRSQMESN